MGGPHHLVGLYLVAGHGGGEVAFDVDVGVVGDVEHDFDDGAVGELEGWP
jgi:hypothetical protein